MEPIASSVFDTQSLPPHERFSAWQNSIGVIFDASLDHRADPLTMCARVEATMLGQVVLGNVVSQTQRFQRPKQKILADGLDCYLVQVFLTGSCEVQDGAHKRLVRPGDIYILDASAPLDAVDYNFSHLTMLIPRDILSPALIRPDAHHRKIITREMPLANLLYGFICNVHANRSSMTLDDGIAASAALLSLTENLLNARLPGAPAHLPGAAVDLASMQRIIDFIDANLHDEALGPDLIVAALGISRTRLYRMFRRYSGIAAEIKRRRLRRSLQDLLAPGLNRLRIGEIAYRWGFRSESDFIRSFKQRYEMTPGEARKARALTPTSAGETSNYYEHWIAGLAR